MARIAGIDLPKEKRVEIGLTYIYGIGRPMADKILAATEVNPDTREFFVTDAADYVTPGYLYCYTPEGRLKWRARTGDIPAHFAFTTSPVSFLTFINKTFAA